MAGRQGITLPDGSAGDVDIIEQIADDLVKVDYGTYVTSATAPSNPADGLLWYDSAGKVFKYWNAGIADWVLVGVGGAGGLAAHIAAIPIDHPDGSVTTPKLADGAVTSAKLGANAVGAGKLANGAIDTAGRFGAGVVSDAAIGNRTVDQALATPADTGPLLSLLSWIVGRIKAITGEADWKTTPATTLALSATHIAAAAPHSGHETPAGATAKIANHTANDTHALKQPVEVQAAGVLVGLRAALNFIGFTVTDNPGSGRVDIQAAGRPRCKVYKTVAATMDENPIAWGAESFDSHGMHDNAVNNSRITISAAAGAGTYMALVQFGYNQGPINPRELTVEFNGTIVGRTSVYQADNASNSYLQAFAIQQCNVGDYFQAGVSSGGAVGSIAGSNNVNVTWMAVYRVD